MTIGGATGGTNPTVDIGSSADDDGFFNEADADKGSLKGADGALVVAGGITAATTVTGKVGASAATGGTITGVFTYTVVDNGARELINLVWAFGLTYKGDLKYMKVT